MSHEAAIFETRSGGGFDASTGTVVLAGGPYPLSRSTPQGDQLLPDGIERNIRYEKQVAPREPEDRKWSEGVQAKGQGEQHAKDREQHSGRRSGQGLGV